MLLYVSETIFFNFFIFEEPQINFLRAFRSNHFVPIDLKDEFNITKLLVIAISTNTKDCTFPNKGGILLRRKKRSLSITRFCFETPIGLICRRQRFVSVLDHSSAMKIANYFNLCLLQDVLICADQPYFCNNAECVVVVCAPSLCIKHDLLTQTKNSFEIPKNVTLEASDKI